MGFLGDGSTTISVNSCELCLGSSQRIAFFAAKLVDEHVRRKSRADLLDGRHLVGILCNPHGVFCLLRLT